MKDQFAAANIDYQISKGELKIIDTNIRDYVEKKFTPDDIDRLNSGFFGAGEVKFAINAVSSGNVSDMISTDSGKFNMVALTCVGPKDIESLKGVSYDTQENAYKINYLPIKYKDSIPVKK